MKIYIKIFYKLVVSFLLVIARLVQSTQNKFAISLQYLKKEGRGEVDFLHADKNQTSYKLILSILVEMASHTQSTQSNNFAKFAISQERSEA